MATSLLRMGRLGPLKLWRLRLQLRSWWILLRSWLNQQERNCRQRARLSPWNHLRDNLTPFRSSSWIPYGRTTQAATLLEGWGMQGPSTRRLWPRR
ncbi:hypothetical protein CRUP_015500 [Coryphaenoides rupestris]|nr:hypothetical protein CRUP_015500 [Coryphaenoides rupestris]